MYSIVLISGHVWTSRRKAGFHHLAKALARRGHEITFMTVALSFISYIRNDYRLDFARQQSRNRLIVADHHIRHFVWHTFWHPVDFRNRLLNYLAAPLAATYPLLPLGLIKPIIREADIIIFESTPGIVLFGRIRHLNPRARLIYRVSDTLKRLHAHPVTLQLEQRACRQFDLISVPSPTMVEMFPEGRRVKVHPQGLDKKAFDRPCPSPYPRGSLNAVWVGVSLFDAGFYEHAAAAFPEVMFHIIGGKFAGQMRAPNILIYPEMNFLDTIPYVKHADIGLATFLLQEGAEHVADSSLKMIQYGYCGLPVIVPSYLAGGRPNRISYTPGDKCSIIAAIKYALCCAGNGVHHEDVMTWDEIAEDLLVDLFAP